METCEYKYIATIPELYDQLTASPNSKAISSHSDRVLELLESPSQPLHVIHTTDSIDVHILFFTIFLKLQRGFLSSAFVIVDLTTHSSRRSHIRQDILIQSFKDIFQIQDEAQGPFVCDHHQRAFLLVMPLDPGEIVAQNLERGIPASSPRDRERNARPKRRKLETLVPSPLSQVTTPSADSDQMFSFDSIFQFAGVSKGKNPSSSSSSSSSTSSSSSSSTKAADRLVRSVAETTRSSGETMRPMETASYHKIRASSQEPIHNRPRGPAGRKRKCETPLFFGLLGKPSKEPSKIGGRLMYILRKKAKKIIIWHELGHASYLDGLLDLTRFGDLELKWKAILGHNIVGFDEVGYWVDELQGSVARRVFDSVTTLKIPLFLLSQSVFGIKNSNLKKLPRFMDMWTKLIPRQGFDEYIDDSFDSLKNQIDHIHDLWEDMDEFDDTNDITEAIEEAIQHADYPFDNDFKAIVHSIFFGSPTGIPNYVLPSRESTQSSLVQNSSHDGRNSADEFTICTDRLIDPADRKDSTVMKANENSGMKSISSLETAISSRSEKGKEVAFTARREKNHMETRPENLSDYFKLYSIEFDRTPRFRLSESSSIYLLAPRDKLEDSQRMLLKDYRDMMEVLSSSAGWRDAIAAKVDDQIIWQFQKSMKPLLEKIEEILESRIAIYWSLHSLRLVENLLKNLEAGMYTTHMFRLACLKAEARVKRRQAVFKRLLELQARGGDDSHTSVSMHHEDKASGSEPR
jgi:hypothetical protein